VSPSHDEAGTRPRDSIDPVAELAEYANSRGLELVAYHDACRQLSAMLGQQFAEDRFADSVLARLTVECNDVVGAVKDAHAAALEA
jgi:hypothetical protein